MGGESQQALEYTRTTGQEPTQLLSHFIVIVLPENSTRQTEKSLVVTRSCALTQTKTYPIQCCRHEMHISVMSVFIVVSLDVFTLNWLSGMLQPPTLCCTDITSETSRAHTTHTHTKYNLSFHRHHKYEYVYWTSWEAVASVALRVLISSSKYYIYTDN